MFKELRPNFKLTQLPAEVKVEEDEEEDDCRDGVSMKACFKEYSELETLGGDD